MDAVVAVDDDSPEPLMESVSNGGHQKTLQVVRVNNAEFLQTIKQLTVKAVRSDPV